jgi:protein tyrosine/serine phosphatase
MVLKAWCAACSVLLLAASAVGAQQSLGGGSVTASATSATTGSAATCKAINWPTADTISRRSVEKGLPDFGVLNANVWRSGQPTDRGYSRLAEMHVKTIVNLRAEFPLEKDRVPAGVQYFYIPITDETAPTEDQAKQFLKIVTNPANWPVLVHCTHGEGRTGVMCALVRYSIDGWDNKRILKEVGNFRHSFLGMTNAQLCSGQQRFLDQWEQSNRPGEYQQAVGSGQ